MFRFSTLWGICIDLIQINSSLTSFNWLTLWIQTLFSMRINKINSSCRSTSWRSYRSRSLSIIYLNMSFFLILTRILRIFTCTRQKSTTICKIANKLFLNCRWNSWISWNSSCCTSTCRSILTYSPSFELDITLIKSWFVMGRIREISLRILFRRRLII